MNTPRVSLRLKLALLALPLLALPWVGYRYLVELEAFLVDSQQQAVLATARAVATALHERPQLLGVPQWTRSSRVTVDQSLLPGEEVVEALRAPVATLAEEPRRMDEVVAILRGVQRSSARISLVSRDLRVLAVTGSLPAAEDGGAGLPAWRRLAARILPPPGETIGADWSPLRAREVHDALMGIAGAQTRATYDGGALLVSAAHPIWEGNRVIGAVVVEEDSRSIVSLRQRALESLLLITLAGLCLVALPVLWFATRLSSRIRRLRDEAESAIDGQGRIAAPLTASNAGDEVGDLSRSFSALLGRLAGHHTYLENMASRLSHELRTPIAVVRSSLENLHAEELPASARTYMTRAEEGLNRLSRMLSRMSEATRMEQALASTESERFDLRAVVGECVRGYRVAHPTRAFEDDLPPYPVWVRGAPDLAAQMLDKLVDNAADFALPDTPIRIVLQFQTTTATLAVINQGPLLPAALAGRMFEAMVSVRKAEGGGEPHLGLGLYVARMIAAFHGGSLSASNLPDGSGVCVGALLRLA
ncbi:ATP-binding protein [Thauera sp. SDU_THAU2]|uniref:ATP-binding protein n=1 Tax=Thauera sp. SDU_THAU2 TaxID=3136633 RepID=UPI00311E2C92